jgi:predicted metal-dependent hydrolase
LPTDGDSRTRDRLTEGRAAFDRGAFFEAHELWEAIWRELSGDERTAVQGLIQIAAALHHLQGGRPGPAARLLAKGVEKISRCSPALRAALGTDAVVRVACDAVGTGHADDGAAMPSPKNPRQSPNGEALLPQIVEDALKPASGK